MRTTQKYEPVNQQFDTHDRQVRRYNYRVTVLRDLALLSWLVMSLVLIGLLQYASMGLPQKDRFDLPWWEHTSTDNNGTPSDIARRRDETYSSESSADFRILPIHLTTRSTSQPDSYGPQGTSKTAFVDPDVTVTLPHLTAPGKRDTATTIASSETTTKETVSYTTSASMYTASTNYIPPKQTIISPDPSDAPSTTALATVNTGSDNPETLVSVDGRPESDYVRKDRTVTSPSRVGRTDSTAFVSTGLRLTSSVPTATSPEPSQGATDEHSTDTFTALSAPRSIYVDHDKTVSIPKRPEATRRILDTIDEEPKYDQDVTSTPEVIMIVTSIATIVEVPSIAIFTASLSGEPSARIWTAATTVASTIYTSYELTYTVASTVSSATPTVMVSDTHHPGKPDDIDVIVYKWTVAHVFVSRYLAVLLAVLFRIILTTIGNALILIEPFRMMTSSTLGTSAGKVSFRFYHKQSTFLDPFRALLLRCFTLCLTTTVCLLASVLPALASEAIWVDTDWQCPVPDLSAPNPCPPQMTASGTIIRILQGILGLVALTIMTIAWTLRGSMTGLTSDPGSIASIKALMAHHDTTAAFETLPVGLADKTLQRHFQGKPYRLGPWKNDDEVQKYGIIPVFADNEEHHTSTTRLQRGEDLAYQSIRRLDDLKTKPFTFRLQDVILIVVVTGSFAVVLAYYLDSSNSGFNRFFNSNTFGPRLILTLAGTAISIMWKSIEQQAMITAPFHRLRKDLCDTTAINFTPTTTPLLSTYRAIQARYWTAALFTIMTLLSEALNVVISGVPFTKGQMWLQFLVLNYMSIGILSLMLPASVFLLVHRRRAPPLSVEPDTLGAKMYLIANLARERADDKAGIIYS